jgi:DmsE family decaheme c-type cytochrome
MFAAAAGLLLFAGGCAQLLKDKPLLPVQAYEKMIVGRLDAEYVGTDNCIAKCHKHDKITDDFKRSVHGEQRTPDTGLPLVNCESCHGPGSLAIERIEENVRLHGEQGQKCDTSTLLDLAHLPPQAQSLICLKCHTTASIPTLSHWNASPHALNDVSCFDCHKLHQGPQQKVSQDQMAEMCYRCHPEVRAENALLSHHPLREKKMACVDCHNPHGSVQDKLLKGNTPKETCTRCHMEKQGPFVFEHADVTENCTNCHTPHGSVNRSLLNAAQPFLCLQCHNSHGTGFNTIPGAKQLFMNRCTDCHSQIHGTDVPSANGKGQFHQ